MSELLKQALRDPDSVKRCPFCSLHEQLDLAREKDEAAHLETGGCFIDIGEKKTTVNIYEKLTIEQQRKLVSLLVEIEDEHKQGRLITSEENT